jgi:hypothetical protein
MGSVDLHDHGVRALMLAIVDPSYRHSGCSSESALTAHSAVMKQLALSAVLLLVVVSTAWAQDVPFKESDRTDVPVVTDAAPDLPIVPGTPEQSKELVEWFKEAKAFQKWDQQWRGVAQWNWAGRVAERRREPQAPAWMVAACDDFRDGKIAATQLLVDACELKKELARNYDDLAAQNIALAQDWHRKQNEDLDKSWFLSKIHFDAPYILAQSDGWRVFSYFGVHITPFDIKKRMYIWLPPGFSLVSIPNGDGRKLVPAYGAGLSFRWFDFRFPGASNQSTMYFNVSEFFIPDSSVPGVDNKLTMMGLSFTGKKPK